MIETATNSREKTLGILKTHFEDLRETFGVSRLSIFGSVARGRRAAGSDVDVLVEFERPIGIRFVEFADRLESLLGTKVDVLTPDGVSSIRNPRIARSIRESLLDVSSV